MKLAHGCACTPVPLISLQLMCHADSRLRLTNPLFMNSFQDYKTVTVEDVLFSGFSCEIQNKRLLPRCMLLLCLVTHSQLKNFPLLINS